MALRRCKLTEHKGLICANARSLAAIFWLVASLSAETRLTLEQAGSRIAPDWTPVYDGKEVIVSGQVSALPIRVSESLYLPIQDQAGYGLLLEGTERQFRELTPGDWVESLGTIARHAGLAVEIPRTLRRTGWAAPPTPKVLRVSELASFRYLGVLISTESGVQEKDNASGDLISIGERGRSIDVVLPRTRRESEAQPYGFHSGDRVRVTGIDSQFCRLPPYNRFFQILVPDPASIAVVEKAWMIPPPMLLASVMLASALLAIWWFRERRMAALRRRMRVLNSLGEDVIGATSPAEILRRLELTLPQISASSGTGMYLLNRGTKSLESVHVTGTLMESIELDNPRSGMASGIAACFRNRTLIAIPDTRRSPFFKESGGNSPRAAIFVPMFAQSELAGVLALHNTGKIRYYSHADQAALQHLANQVATALKLQEQHSVREQLFRSEKLAAAGQLISEIANELRLPLESVVARASALRSHRMDDFREELESIAADAQRASQIVTRLDSLAKVEQTDVQAVDLTALLTGLLQFREPECKAKGVEIRSQLNAQPTIIMGSPGQLEQVLLNLLVDSEKAAADAREKLITVSSSLLARRMLVEISYSTRSTEFQRLDAADNDHLGGGALALGACRGIIQSHGGEFRSVRVSPVQARFDIELQAVEQRSSGAALGTGLGGRSRQLNVLVVDPDAKVQHQILQLLGDRGDRVVPVSNAEEGVDLVQRMRFDIALCAVRQPGLNWVEFFERVRYQVGGFVLLTDGFDTDLARAFQGSEGFVLSKPIDDAEVLRICSKVEERTGLARG